MTYPNCLSMVALNYNGHCFTEIKDIRSYDFCLFSCSGAKALNLH